MQMDTSMGALTPFYWSMEQLGQRVDTVTEEIDDIWHSPMSERQKEIQTSSRKLEIALLRAGQFAMCKAALSLRV